MCILTVII